MKIKKVKHYKDPKYPTRDVYALNPHLLGAWIPSNWLKSKAVMGTVMAFILSGYECQSYDQPSLPQKQEINPESKQEAQKVQNQNAEAKIAPVFIHGDGHGATGCVVLSPPIFLSEAEAIEIIINELKKENIIFDKKDFVLKDFSTQEQFTNHGTVETDYVPDKHPFILDAYSNKYNLGIKFISQYNYYKLGGPYSLSSCKNYDFVELAYNLKEELRHYNHINAALFYDPLVGHDANYYMDSEREKIEEEHSRKLLLEQVRDFIKWFKTEIAHSDGNEK